jgi:hypothetical protein
MERKETEWHVHGRSFDKYWRKRINVLEREDEKHKVYTLNLALHNET